MLPQSLIKMYESGEIRDEDNNVRKFDHSISLSEAELLSKIVADTSSTRTLETGLANGGSALAICNAKTGNNKMHYGVDPNQKSEYNNAAVHNLELEGQAKNFTLLEGPSHSMLPPLISSGVILDFAFVDGWHTFDYTLIDFFLIDKMLKPGGYIAFHDMYAPSKQKVVKYILSHRKYEIDKTYAVRGNESRSTTMKFFLWRMYKYPTLIFSKYHWRFQLRNSSGLLVLKKTAQYEPNFDFYKNF